jgi:hypothetical protein
LEDQWLGRWRARAKPSFCPKNTLPETGKNHRNFRWKPQKNMQLCDACLGVFSSPSSVFTHVGWQLHGLMMFVGA